MKQLSHYEVMHNMPLLFALTKRIGEQKISYEEAVRRYKAIHGLKYPILDWPTTSA